MDHLYRHAFLTICKMVTKNEVVELTSLYLEMGRPENISEIIDNSDSEVLGPLHYANLLRKRNLEDEISRLAKEREFQKAKEAIKEIENLGRPATLLSISNMIEANPDKSDGVATGYQDLDKMVKMKRSDLIILAGKTSIGKTTLGLTILGNIAKREPTGLISFEMSPQGIVKRLSEIYPMDYLSQINSSFFVSCPNAFTLSETRKSIQNMKQKYDTRIFMIDYLQLMQEPRQYRSRHLEVSYIIRKLKEMGTEMKVIMIVVAQLSRNIDARGENAIPCLGDLKECIVPGTEIQTDKGKRTIKSLHNGHLNFKVKSYNQKTGSIEFIKPEKVIHTGSKKCLRIRTKSGKILILSAETPIFNGTDWIKTKDMKPGDKVLVDSSIPNRHGVKFNTGSTHIKRGAIPWNKGQTRESNNKIDDLIRKAALEIGGEICRKINHLFLDEVMEVSEVGKLDTFDFVITENHCFFANGILIHNSGDIEYASDIVLFLHRERNSNNADLIVAKQRYGEKCIVKLIWLKDRLTYGSYEWREKDDR